MADIDLLPQRGIPRLALVDGNGIALSGSKTMAQLAAAGMRSICQVDQNGLASGGATVAQLASRGIRCFAAVDQLGVSTDDAVTTADTLRRRGIRPMVAVDASGIAQAGTATMPTLAQRGLQCFCPVNETGTATSLIPVPPNTIRALVGVFPLTGENMEVITGYMLTVSAGAFAIVDPGTTKLTPPGGAYQGPGDVKSGAYAWWGLRAYSAASIGLPAVDISITGGAVQTFSTIAGGGLDTAAIATFIAGDGRGYISKLYDQSGNNRHLLPTAPTWQNGPQFIVSGQGGKPVMRAPNPLGNGSTLSSTALSVANPSIVFAAKRTVFATEQYAYGDVNVSLILGGWRNIADTAFIHAGTGQNYADAQDNATTSNWHAFAHVYATTRTSSFVYLNSALVSLAGSPGANGIGASFGIMNTVGQGDMTGDMAEFGIWATQLTGPECVALNANSKTYLGF